MSTTVKYTPTEQDIRLTTEITDFFKDTGIEYKEDPKIFGCYHLNDGKLQIRYVNSYYHRIDMSHRFGGIGSGVSQNYFAEISQKNKNEGIRTIWIFDFEMLQTNPGTTYRRMWNVLQNYIRTATGHISTRIFGRHCEVREVTNAELKPFLEQNCFYGYRAASKNIGLYLKKDRVGLKAGTLLMVYTFGYNYYGNKNRKDNPFIEVIRVATLLGCQVVAGASKCLKHFLMENETLHMGDNDYKVDELRYYSDASHNSGQSLETIGFNFVEWKNGGFMNILMDDINEVYTRPDGKKIGIKGNKGEVQQRKPAAHKRIMELMSEGKIISVGNAGTSVWSITRDQFLSRYNETSNSENHE